MKRAQIKILESWVKQIARFVVDIFHRFGGVQKRGIQIVDVRHEANAALLRMLLLEYLVWLV